MPCQAIYTDGLLFHSLVSTKHMLPIRSKVNPLLLGSKHSHCHFTAYFIIPAAIIIP